MIFYVAKSKKSGNYFKFEQYDEDGYGKYEDSISKFDFSQGEMPHFFIQDQVERRMFTEFKDHAPEDVTFVKVMMIANEIST